MRFRVCVFAHHTHTQQHRQSERQQIPTSKTSLCRFLRYRCLRVGFMLAIGSRVFPPFNIGGPGCGGRRAPMDERCERRPVSIPQNTRTHVTGGDGEGERELVTGSAYRIQIISVGNHFLVVGNCDCSHTHVTHATHSHTDAHNSPTHSESQHSFTHTHTAEIARKKPNAKLLWLLLDCARVR